MTNNTTHSTARRLARFRVALVALVAVIVVLITVVPAKLFGYGMSDPASVLFSLGVLGVGWVAFVATAVAGARLRNAR